MQNNWLCILQTSWMHACVSKSVSCSCPTARGEDEKDLIPLPRWCPTELPDTHTCTLGGLVNLRWWQSTIVYWHVQQCSWTLIKLHAHRERRWHTFDTSGIPSTTNLSTHTATHLENWQELFSLSPSSFKPRGISSITDIPTFSLPFPSIAPLHSNSCSLSLISPLSCSISLGWPTLFQSTFFCVHIWSYFLIPKTVIWRWREVDRWENPSTAVRI